MSNQYNTPAPPVQLIKPGTAGAIAAASIALASYLFINKYAKKASTPVKIGASAGAGALAFFLTRNVLQSSYDRRLSRYYTDIQFTGAQIPGGSFNLPAIGTPTQTASFDPEIRAGEFINAYNPEGWSTDEQALMDLLGQTPPKMFSTVARAYTQLYSRNLLNDLDSALLGTLFEVFYKQYKQQIK